MSVTLERWNEDKMDALATKVDALGGQLIDLREQLRENRQDLREVRQDLQEHRKETKQGFESLHRTMVQTAVALSSSFVLGFAALIGLVATQL